MNDKAKRCSVCHGRGHFHCDCWPGDCICGYDYEECEYCDGTGYVLPDDYWFDHEEPYVNADEHTPNTIGSSANEETQ